MLNTEIGNLPWATVLFVASGYGGYFIANTGSREHHKTIDIAFSSAVFGFFALFCYNWMMIYRWNIGFASVSTFFVACLMGAFWRRAGRVWFVQSLRFLRITFADDSPSAWVSLFQSTNVNDEQLAVLLKNGVWLECDNLSIFCNSPNGPCVFGANGDILMYVTHSKEPGGERIENIAVKFEGWGDQITYIPSSEIARIDFRRAFIYPAA